jgi:hypothetical protein
MSADADDGELRVGDRLPKARDAIVPVTKLRDYALRADHPVGGPKARVFASVLGLTSSDWEHLHDELHRTLPEGRVARIDVNSYATTYRVLLRIRGLDRREAQVISAWRLSSDVPHLVTVYVDVDALGG